MGSQGQGGLHGWDEQSTTSEVEAPLGALQHVNASNLEDWFELDRSVRIHRELMRAIKNIAVQTWQNYFDADADPAEVVANAPGGVDYSPAHPHAPRMGGGVDHGSAVELFSPTPQRFNRAARSSAYLDSPPPRPRGSPGKTARGGTSGNPGAKTSSRPPHGGVFRKLQGALIRKTRSDLRGVLEAADTAHARARDGGGDGGGGGLSDQGEYDDDDDVLSLRFFANPPSLQDTLATGNLAPPSGHSSTTTNNNSASQPAGRHGFTLPALVIPSPDDDRYYHFDPPNASTTPQTHDTTSRTQSGTTNPAALGQGGEECQQANNPRTPDGHMPLRRSQARMASPNSSNAPVPKTGGAELGMMDSRTTEADAGVGSSTARDRDAEAGVSKANGGTTAAVVNRGNLRPTPISTRHESVESFMDFAPTPKSVGSGRSMPLSESAMKLNLQPLQLGGGAEDLPAGAAGGRRRTHDDVVSGTPPGGAEPLIGRHGRQAHEPIQRHNSAPVMTGRGHATPPGHIMRNLSRSRHAQRRKMMLRARDATPAAREGYCIESGTIPQVYQELLDIFWPSRLRQQMLSASPLSCSYGDMAQAWGFNPAEAGSDANQPRVRAPSQCAEAAGDTAATDGERGNVGGANGGRDNDGDHEDDDDDEEHIRRMASSDWSPISGTILFPAHRNYLAFRFEFVIAAVLKKHQTFSQEWCVSFRNSTFHKNFIEQFCQSLHHFPGIQSLTFRISETKQADMLSKEFDEAIYAMLVPGVLPEWISWLTLDGCFFDRVAPEVLAGGIRALWRKSLHGGLNGLALRNQRYTFKELRPVIQLLVDFGRRQHDGARGSPTGTTASAAAQRDHFNSSTGSSSSASGSGATPHSPSGGPTLGGRRFRDLLPMASPNGLAWLDLSGNALGDLGAATLVRLLATSGNTHLRGIDLSDNRIMDGDRLVSALVTPIEFVSTQSGKQKNATAAAAAAAATGTGSPQEGEDETHWEEDEYSDVPACGHGGDVQTGSASLRHHHSRSNLGSRVSGSGSGPAKCLLHRNRSLIAIKLAHNRLSPSAVQRLNEALAHDSCSLRLLDLSFNGLDLDAANAAAAAAPQSDHDAMDAATSAGARPRRATSPAVSGGGGHSNRRESTPGSARSRGGRSVRSNGGSRGRSRDSSRGHSSAQESDDGSGFYDDEGDVGHDPYVDDSDGSVHHGGGCGGGNVNGGPTTDDRPASADMGLSQLLE